MKKVTIHQPEHLPYQGFFAKVLKSNIFVVLDHVQFRRRYFQNRNRIIDKNGKEIWLTIPLEKSPLSTPLNEKFVSKNQIWKENYLQIIKDSYSKCQNFNLLFPKIEKIINCNYSKLVDINFELINFFLKDIFNHKGKIIFSSDLNILSKKSDLILDICKILSADIYISGVGGESYLDVNEFEKEKIKVKFIEFNPVPFSKNYSPLISVIDPLMKYEFNFIKEKIISNSSLR